VLARAHLLPRITLEDPMLISARAEMPRRRSRI
jgi:hypothetical protein